MYVLLHFEINSIIICIVKKELPIDGHYSQCYVLFIYTSWEPMDNRTLPILDVQFAGTNKKIHTQRKHIYVLYRMLTGLSTSHCVLSNIYNKIQ